jgi:hypothetical protein
LNAAVSKTVSGLIGLTRVRIPPPPLPAARRMLGGTAASPRATAPRVCCSAELMRERPGRRIERLGPKPVPSIC